VQCSPHFAISFFFSARKVSEGSSGMAQTVAKEAPVGTDRLDLLSNIPCQNTGEGARKPLVVPHQ
jgi:hypothetical protein